MKFTELREILHYVPRFRERVFVIAIDGQMVEDDNFPNLVLDIAVLRSLNIQVLIVHGASHQIRQLAAETGQPVSNDDGTGVTDAQTLKFALTAANRLTHEIIEGLSANDLRAASTNAILAHPAGILGGVDQQFTGHVERVDTDLLQTLLDKDIIPVVPPLGFDGNGRTYRLNSDAVALAITAAIRTVKLLFITPHDGIQKSGKLVPQLTVTEAEELLRKNRDDLVPATVSKLEHAIKAVHEGTERVHIINGRVEEGLLAEVFSKEGIGTLIHTNEYQAIRQARKKDIRTILNLIKNSVRSEELVKRTRNDIERQLDDYYVFELDRNPVGCVALHLFPNDKKGELACLYVSSDHENEGIGRKLMNFVEKTAREKGCRELFLLSTQTFAYFQQKGGFIEGNVDDLPKERRGKYEQSGRNSKVLYKSLVTA
ncbi:MAG: amino-acid N-acetyltransferase [Verrucomicrobiae bacterium]|nr:amino-acid N-acetyltransferase [Verrucomicrobiae bacterium]